MMPYQMAFWLCGILLALAAAMYFSRKPVLVRYMPFPRETGTVLGLFGLWQVAGRLSVMKVDGALSRGTWLWDVERSLYLPSEHWVQHLFFPAHSAVLKFFNIYYATMHFTCMIIFLVWLFALHREHYPRVRTTMAMATAFALAIQLVPVAPPRMIEKAHLVDTAFYFHQSVYGPIDPNSPNQLSAMPSVHVIWAVLVGWTVWRVSSSRWRWIGPAHAVLTVVVVVATANHYWADGIVGVALLVLSVGIQTGVRRGAELVRGSRVTSAKVPEPELARSS